MMKTLLCFLLFLTPLFADYFREGMLAYKEANYTQAKEFFELAIKKENSQQSYFYLGKIYLYGEGVEVNPTLAIPYLEQAAMKGNIQAKCYLADAYLKSHMKHDEAVTLLKQGAKQSATCKEIASTYNIDINS